MKIIIMEFAFQINLVKGVLQAYANTQRSDIKIDSCIIGPLGNALVMPHNQITLKNITIFYLPLFLIMLKNFKSGRDIFNDLENQFRYLQFEKFSYSFIELQKLRTLIESQLNVMSFKEYDLVSFSPNPYGVLHFILTIFWMKKNHPNKPLIAGNIYLKLNVGFRKILLESGLLDSVIIGEGEISILKIIETLESGGVLDKIYSNQILDLNSLPIPSLQTHSGLTLIYSSRGCTNTCNYCTEPYGSKFKRINSSKFVDWVEEFHIKHGSTSFSINDSLFNSTKKYVLEIHQGLKEKGLLGKVNFPFANVRLDKLDKETIKALKEMKIHLYLGLEHNSQRILNLMGKKVDLPKVMKNIDTLDEFKLRYTFGLIAGFPSETMKEFQEFLKLTTRPYKTQKWRGVRPNFFRLSPGSFIYNNPEKFEISLIPFPKNIQDILPEYSKYVQNITMTYLDHNDPDNSIRIKKLDMFIKFEKQYTANLKNNKIKKIRSNNKNIHRFIRT